MSYRTKPHQFHRLGRRSLTCVECGNTKDHPLHVEKPKAPEHIEVKYARTTYRYYGYAHVPNAKSLGEGDWRRVSENGEEIKMDGVLIPADVLLLVADSLKKTA